MPQTTEELVHLLDLEEIEIGLYRGAQPQTQLQRTYGGQVLAQSLMAAYGTVGDDRMCHSLHAYFLRGGKPDKPIIYDVESVRDGESFTSRRVVARQGGRPIFTMNANFHIEEGGLDHSDPMPRGVPDPEQCPSLMQLMQERLGVSARHFAEWDALDVRFAGDSGESAMITPGAHQAHMRVWVRTTSALPDDQRLHQAVLAYLSDITILSVSTVPHQNKVAFLSPAMNIASLDHAMWFHRPVRADEWVLYDQVSPSASNALGFSTGRLVQGNALVASCSQEGMIRVVG
ncbi:acyl-CoA thioesterase [Luteococcus sp. Sow4_B9]|uniref:acyl-CoA thioesterase n=1 Tax=Luteococcus sp. Sow4_B9 TaxID=3438792 RepID=UPI003F97D776